MSDWEKLNRIAALIGSIADLQAVIIGLQTSTKNDLDIVDAIERVNYDYHEMMDAVQ